jgi:hypothetical protein
MAQPSASGCLGAYVLRPSLGRHASKWLCQTPCSHAGYLGVSTLHPTKIDVVSPNSSSTDYQHCNYTSRPCWVLLFKASLRSARLQGLPEVDPTRFLAAMLGDLGASTLHSIKTMTQFSSFLSIKPSMMSASMLRDYSTSVSLMPSCFPRRIDLLGNPFLITSLLDLLFLLFFFFVGPSYRPSCRP